MTQATGLQKPIQILLFLILAFTALHFGKPFLIPVCLAALFAMLFIPVCEKLEKKGFNRGIASFFCILVFLIIVSVIVALVAWQITNLTADFGNIQDKIQSAWQQISQYISDSFGVSREQQEKVIEDQSGNASDAVEKIGSMLINVVVNFILVLVYIFLFIYFRARIKKFILQVTPKKADGNTEAALDEIEKVAQQYLTGIGLMIFCLWIMYGIAFSIIGLKHSIFFAILCGLFEIVPFIGNLTGNTLAVLMALTQGGGMPMVIGIIISYAFIQFFQTYVLEPLVVGTEVNINPLFTIMGLVVGEIIWGIPSLMLAIPLMGILKIVFDHIPSLKPYGYLMGYEKKNKTTLADWIKSKFGRGDKKEKKK